MELPQTNVGSLITRIVIAVAGVLFFLSGSGAFTQDNSQVAVLLFPDKPLSRQITDERSHFYLIGAHANQYLRIAIVLNELSMRVRLIAPNGRVVNKSDNFTGRLDKWTVSAITTDPGFYRLEVIPFRENVPQSYTVFIDEQRAATPSDPNRVAAENLLMQAERLRPSVERDSAEKAISAFEDALKIYKDLNELKGQAYVTASLGELHESLNQKQKALNYFQQALRAWQATEDDYHAAATLNNIGAVYNSMNEKPEALSTLAQSLALWRTLGDRNNEADTIVRFAQIYANLGDKERAVNHYHRALDIWRETNNRQGEAFTLTGLGQLYETIGDRSQALSYYQKADSIWQKQYSFFGYTYIRGKERMGVEASAGQISPSSRGEAAAAISSWVQPLLDQETEQELWQRIKTSNDPDAYSAYLRSYPDGRFRNQARRAGLWLAIERQKSTSEGAAKQGYSGSTRLTAAQLAQLDQITFGTHYESLPKKTTEVKRYPTIECPDPVTAEQEFDVLISLTAKPVSAETKIVSGKGAEGGGLQVKLPATDSWQIGVVLVAPDFVFPRGNSANLILPKDGDSPPARITLRSKTIQGSQQPSRIYATFWHGGTFLGKAVREIKIVGSFDNPRSKISSLPGPASEAQPKKVSPISVDEKPRNPDLIVQFFDSSSTGRVEILITSDYLPKRQPEPIQTKKPSEWLNLQYNQFFQKSAGLAELPQEEMSSQQSEDAKSFMLGFGEQLYNEFCPEPLKRALRELIEKRGRNFKTIQIYSNNFDLPWELMRPVNRDGTVRSFLGVEFAVARWHWSESMAAADPLPQSIPIRKLVVIAPQYKGRDSTNQREEINTLKLINGYERLPGQLKFVRDFFTEFPQAFVYFAGHGSLLPTEHDLNQYSIELEDGKLDLLTWRGLITHQSKNHPFLFFNACEVGQTQRIANFVDGWAPAALEAGASGYIGALWPVSDGGAARFGATFHRSLELRLRDGPVSIPQILTETRRRFLDQGDPTFLAYVYFGDANLTLSTQAPNR